MTNEQYAGYWWTSKSPSQRVPGTLSIDSQNDLTLTLTGGLQVPRGEPGHSQVAVGLGDFDVILGECGGKRITLLNSRLVRANSLPVSRRDISQTIHATMGLIGVHLEDSSSIPFNKLSLRVANLVAMSGSPTDLNSDGSINMAEDVNLDQVVRIEGVKYALVFHRSNLRRALLDGATVSHTAYYTVDSVYPRPLDLKTALGHARDVQDLVAFATNSPSGVAKAELRSVEFDDSGEIEVAESGAVELKYGDLAALDLESTAAPRHELFISFADLPFTQLFPRWLEYKKKFSTPSNMYLSSIYRQPTYVETRMVIAVAAAEAFNRCYEDGQALISSDYGMIINAIEKLPSDLADWAKARLRNEPSLRERLKDLVRTLESPEMIGLIGDVDKWVKLTRDFRNNTAHGLGADEVEHDNQVFSVALVASAIVAAHSLKWLGLDSDAIGRLITENPYFVWCGQMAKRYIRA